MKKSDYQSYQKAIALLNRPCAFLDLNHLEENINKVLADLKGKKLRIATKSIRSVAVLNDILKFIQHNSIDKECVSGLMAYHPQEALDLARELKLTDGQDILIAYPYMGQQLIEKTLNQISDEKITFMCDLPEHLHLLAKLANEKNTTVRICLDLDVSTAFPGLHFGVYRSSISSLAILKDRLDLISQHPQLKLVGLMGYEAQIAGVGELNPWNFFLINFIVKFLKNISAKKVIRYRQEVLNLCQARGIELEYFNGGGSGSLKMDQQDHALSEVAAGSAFFAPHLFDYYRDLDLRPSLGVALEVTRRPRKNIITCAGGGYVASGSMSKDKFMLPVYPPDVSLLENEMTGEVQTPLKINAKSATDIQVGDSLFFRPAKAGEICERFNHLALIRNGVCEKVVDTYRGQGRCYL